MLTLMGVGILGAIDDFVNVRTGIGMRGRWKLVWQTAVAILAAFYIWRHFDLTGLNIPLVGQFEVAAPLLIAFIATVIGGMRSLQGAVLGGFVLAFIDTGLNYTLPQHLLQFRDAFTFSMVILILLWRPEGLMRGPASGQRTCAGRCSSARPGSPSCFCFCPWRCSCSRSSCSACASSSASRSTSASA